MLLSSLWLFWSFPIVFAHEEPGDEVEPPHKVDLTELDDDSDLTDFDEDDNMRPLTEDELNRVQEAFQKLSPKCQEEMQAAYVDVIIFVFSCRLIPLNLSVIDIIKISLFVQFDFLVNNT